MTIPYVGLEVQIHGLDLTSAEDVEVLRAKVRAAIVEGLPELVQRFDTDVVVEVTEHAGGK